MAALGMETSAGDFEVIDLCFAGLPDLVSPPSFASNGDTNANGDAPGKGKGKAHADGGSNGNTPEGDKTWVAVVSGLSVGSDEAPADLKTEMLVEWLTGESGGDSVRLGSRRTPSLRVLCACSMKLTSRIIPTAAE
jgi:DNA polymerase delta subunit 2